MPFLFEIRYKPQGALCEVKHRFENLSSSREDSQTSRSEDGELTVTGATLPKLVSLMTFHLNQQLSHARALHFREGRRPTLASHSPEEREVLRSQPSLHEAPQLVTNG